MEELIGELGYLALAIGTFFEGEIAILISSSLAAAGSFNIYYVVLFGFLGSFVSDWLYFLMGRMNGAYFVDKRPALKSKIEPVRHFFERNQWQLLISYRFLYGFRIVIPLMIGMSDIKILHFLGFSIGSGLLWSSMVSSLGYFTGLYFDLNQAFFKENIVLLIAGFAGVGLLMGLLVNRFVGLK